MNRVWFGLLPTGKVPLCFLFLIAAFASNAQLTNTSPYSRYGIGDLQSQNSVLNFSMGGTGTAYRNDSLFPFFVNLKNPASYVFNSMPSYDSTRNLGIRIANFEAGILDYNIQQTTEGQTTQSNNANFGYLALTFPIGKHFGGAFGITPYSSEGYDILTTGTIFDNSTSTPQSIYNEYLGSGGINKGFVGLAYSPFKNLSIGANASYLFGSLRNEEDLIFLNANTLSAQKVENVSVRDFYFDFGLLYSFNLGRHWQVTIGATAAMAQNVNADYNILTVGYFNGSSGQINADTIQDSNANGKIKLPLMLAGGITIKKGERWTFSVDYTVQNWNQFSYFGTSESLNQSSSLGFGIQYVPSKSLDKSISYFKKIYYRFGISAATTYLDLNNTQLNDQYVSFGFGFPIGIRRKPQLAYNTIPVNSSILNIGVQIGQLGTTSNDLIKQNYVKIMFGFTFNDQWFIKRKFD